nr:hypothetical protein [Tanacetum cinerariifolium]
MIIKIKEMRNEVSVNGAAVTILMKAIESVNACFVNTLYGYFIDNRLAFSLVENYVKNTWAKYGLKRIQLHEEFFLFQFNTKEGMESVLENGPWLIRRVPLLLNEWTTNTILKKMRLSVYQFGLRCTMFLLWRILISAYARVLTEIAADVKQVKSLIIAIPMGNNEGHTFATIDIEYEWTPPRCDSCCIFDHVSEKCPKLPKVASNEKVIEEGFIEVKKKKTKTKKKSKKQVEECVNVDDQTLVESQFVNDSDEDVDKYITMEETSKAVIYDNKLSVCVILESHVATRNLERLCKHVFKNWNWISNAMSYLKGTRIIVGWNQNDVDVAVIHQDPQVIHTRIWIKANRKEFFCSFVYAFNKYIHRRTLWNGLCLHKNYINNRPWSLLGDFNAPLFLEDTSVGSSYLDVTMREFKECVENMEVMDVQRTGQQYTWNQKPKGKDGILRKLDRVLANLEFLDVFVGAHAVFKPYRISDHSPAVLSIPSLVKKLKGLKKPIRKLIYDKGNLHANVIRLRKELDKVQTDLDSDPNNLSLREKEAVTVTDFNEALLMEEKFLKQKAKITWLKEGDSNTTYFHKVVKSRVSRSRIDVVTDAYGNVHHSTEVAKAFINHYEIFLGQEVKSAMFSMGNDKSPGPDGFTAAFFKDAWHIIGVDVIKAVNEFFTNGRLLKELNHTIIALIPKVNTPARVTVYRPILCCNVLFKCISKIIANCLKAYDTVDWDFLWVILIGFGFHERMISWILECVTTTSFSISINGPLHGYFEGKQGLLQGDPLLPYLFTLIMEVFTLMLKRRVSETSTFTYHRFCSELDLINICFTDDLFLFAHGDVNSAKVIKDALDDFKDASGLNPNRLPVKYLGVPLVSSRLISKDCKELIDKVQNCVNDWKLNSLSIAGRLQLIQYVLSSMHVYWASVFMLPSRVLLDIEKILRGFLWSLDNTSRGKVKVAWDKLLSLKESIWVKWIHVYKLKNRSFWDIPYRGKMSWSWRKLLLLRPLIQEIIWSCIGDGRTNFMWFDKWCVAGPLSNIISSRDITRAGFNHASKVRDSIQDGLWIWPNDWLVKYPILNSIPTLVISDDNSDSLEWHCRDGAGPSLASIITHLLPIAKRKSSKSCIGKLVVAAAAYFIWHERNSRLFNKAYEPEAPLSLVYTPTYPKYLAPSDDDIVPIEDQPLPAPASPIALLSNYSIDFETAEENPGEDLEMDPVDYPSDKEEEEEEEEESFEEEEEEPLAPVDSASPVPFKET